MDKKDPLHPFEEEEAVEGVISEFLQNQFKHMSPQMAALWANAIMKGEEPEKTEMNPLMAERIQKERDRVNRVTDPLVSEKLQASYAKALEENDVLTALDLHEEAESLGINLEDEIPSSALS